MVHVTRAKRDPAGGGATAGASDLLVRNLLRIMTMASASDRGAIFEWRRGDFVPVVTLDLAGLGAGDEGPEASGLADLPRRLLRRMPWRRGSATLCLPLMQGSVVTGAVCLERPSRRGDFTRTQRRLMTLLAQQAASTMDLLGGRSDRVANTPAERNPQFLHNTLSVIAELVRTDPNKAESAIVMLSRLHRYLLESCRRIVTLEEEVAMSRDYMTLESYRLGDRMQAQFDVAGPVDRVHVPSLFLQMLLENVVSHGVAGKVGPGHVEVEVSVNPGHCRVRIQDDGPTWRERAAHAGAGLRRVRDRLALHYPRRYSFSIRKLRPFAVDIRIPRGDPNRPSSHRSA